MVFLADKCDIWVTSLFNVCSWWAAVVVACPNVENFAVGVGKSLVMVCNWWWGMGPLWSVILLGGPGQLWLLPLTILTTRVNQQWWLATS